MERRLLTFFIASTAFFLFYMSLRAMFAPPIPDQPGPNQPLAGNEAAEVQDGAAQENPIGDPIEGTDDDSEDAKEPKKKEIARPDLPVWSTLGSFDPSEDFFLLVTLNSRGGGVERIEITERDERHQLKYRRVDTRSGYLGYLAAQDATSTDGVLVNVIGPGTPADQAGLQGGDVIVAFNDQPILNRLDFEAQLLKTKPKQTVKFKALRSGANEPVELSATLTQHPLDLVRLAKTGGVDQIQGNLSRLSCLITMAQAGRKSISVNEEAIPKLANPASLIWNAMSNNKGDDGEQNQVALHSVAFDLELSANEMEVVGGLPIKLKRGYSLAPKSFVLEMDLEIENLGKQPQDLAYRLEGPNGITMEGWWYSTKICPNWFSGAAARDLVYNTVAENHELISGYELLKFARKNPKDPSQPIFAPGGDPTTRQLRYIGIDAQYFNAAYLPKSGVGSTFNSFRRAGGMLVSSVDDVPRHKERAVNTSFYLDSVAQTVPAGGKIQEQIRFFAGPKKPDLLPKYGLSETIYYGWFALFAKWLAGLLHLLGGLLHNYGIAIIVLTVMVRGAMFPLSRKAAVNAQKMQELAPELKKINEKYKDDMEARMKATREFQSRVGFNPMAGCLPMLIQLPIFMGLYRALSVDIELRQQSLIPGSDWASNLAAPGMLHYWGDWMIDYIAGRGTGWLGPYFNILPMFVVALFLAQQKLFMPPATDEQTRMTQKMMGFMTLFMGLFFFKAPAGLCLYFITSSLWGICERILVKKTLPKGKHFDADVIDGKAVVKERKSENFVDRIKDQINKPEPTFERPNKRKRPKNKKR